ncbi:MAG: hypothetical protein V2I43_02610, partial [Parvularcula sp.]|nr:hypothetical protein [Parvularcula sp.]
TSRYLIKDGVSSDRRFLAAKIISDVDMAPRSALILTLPTGLAAARASGYLDIAWLWVILAFALAALWLGLAWYLHHKHGAMKSLQQADRFIRWALMLGLLIAAVTALGGGIAMPLFVTLKLLVLAACVALGLIIRRVLRPLGPALQVIASPDPAEGEKVLAATLVRARPLVAGIWTLLLIAAFFGLLKPVAL